MTVKLPKLPYSYEALEPIIDSRTMHIHHAKHHQGYADKYNKAVENTEYANKPIDEVLQSLDKIPEEMYTAVRNNGGGFRNHTFFRESMKSGSNDIPAEVKAAITEAFGTIDNFKEQFIDNATGQFGSGRGWLALNNQGGLVLTSTPNQDNPIMGGIGSGVTPLLGIDIREHAYYLHYQNRRGDYVRAWLDIVNWDTVNARYLKAIA